MSVDIAAMLEDAVSVASEVASAPTGHAPTGLSDRQFAHELLTVLAHSSREKQSETEATIHKLIGDLNGNPSVDFFALISVCVSVLSKAFGGNGRMAQLVISEVVR